MMMRVVIYMLKWMQQFLMQDCNYNLVEKPCILEKNIDYLKQVFWTQSFFKPTDTELLHKFSYHPKLNKFNYVQFQIIV